MKFFNLILLCHLVPSVLHAEFRVVRPLKEEVVLVIGCGHILPDAIKIPCLCTK